MGVYSNLRFRNLGLRLSSPPRVAVKGLEGYGQRGLDTLRKVAVVCVLQELEHEMNLEHPRGNPTSPVNGSYMHVSEPCTFQASHMGIYDIGAPYWGPYSKRILLSGGRHWQVPENRNPPPPPRPLPPPNPLRDGIPFGLRCTSTHIRGHLRGF